MIVIDTDAPRRAGLTCRRHPRRPMSDTTDSPAGDDLLRRIEDGICWITLNRPDAGNAMTQFMRDQIAAWVRDASSDLFVRVGRHHRRRRQGLLLGSRPPGRPAGPTAQAGRRTRERRRRGGPHDPGRLAGPRHLHPRLREAGHRRRQRHGGGRRHASRPGLRPRRDGRGGQVRRGLRPPRHRARCGWGLDPDPPGGDPEGQGAVLLRRRRPGGRGLPDRPGQPARAPGRAPVRRWRRWRRGWPAGRPRPSGSPSG